MAFLGYVATIKADLEEYFQEGFNEMDLSPVSRSEFIKEAILQGYDVNGLKELFDKRPEFLTTPTAFLRALWRRDAHLDYGTMTRLALALDDDGSWLWPDIYQWEKLPRDCQIDQINGLGMVRPQGHRVFPSLGSLIESKATSLTPLEVDEMLDWFDIPGSLSHLRDFLAEGGTLKHINWVKTTKGSDGKEIHVRYRDLPDLMNLISEVDGGWDKLKQVIDYRTQNYCQGFFNYLEDAISFVFSGGDVALLQSFESLSRSINGYEAALIARFKNRLPMLFGSEKFLSWPATAPINALIYAEILGANTDFSNDGRPKCLLLLEVEDFREGRLSFLDYAHNLLNLAYDYDTAVVSGYCRKDFLGALQNHPADLSLLVTAFHGSPESVSLSRPLNRYQIDYDQEERRIALSDSEWLQCLKGLPQECSLFMLSCRTAKGGRSATNLANDWSKALGEDRPVTAFRTSISCSQIRFPSRNPLEITTTPDHPVAVRWLGNISTGNIAPFSGHGMEELLERTSSRIVNNAAQGKFQRLLAEIRAANATNIWPNKVDSLYQDLLALEDVNEYLKLTVEQSKNMSAFGFAFGVVLNEYWAAPFGDYHKIIHENPWEYLSERGYEQIEGPEQDAVVVYIAPNGKNKWLAKDFGVCRNKQVIRKLYQGISCPLNYCPAEYSHAVYLKKQTVGTIGC